MKNKKPVIEYVKNNSYEEYVRNQTIVNKQKQKVVWVQESNIRRIKEHFDKLNYTPKNVLCHGVRNGTELQYFNNVFEDVGVLGTEISDTATNWPNVVQWDFHDVNDEWVGQFDIVYTNSWDHSYDLEVAVDTWMEQLKPNGRLILEWASYSTSKPFSKVDCCGCSLETLIDFLNVKYQVETSFPVNNRPPDNISFVIIKHK